MLTALDGWGLHGHLFGETSCILSGVTQFSGNIIECNGNIIKIAYNPTKKSAEFINTVVLASKKEQRKKRAKSKARVLSAETVTEPSSKR